MSTNRTVQLLNGILQSVETLEHDLSARIEEGSDQLLDRSALLTQMIDSFQKSMPHVQALEVLSNNETTRNCEFASSLAKSEEIISINTDRTLKRVKRQLKRLISLIENQ